MLVMMDGSWWLFGLLWSVLLSVASYVLLVSRAPFSHGAVDRDGHNEEKKKTEVSGGRNCIDGAVCDARPVDRDGSHDDSRSRCDAATAIQPLADKDHLSPPPLTLVDLPPDVHCHIVSFLDARSAVGYVGAARALRVLDHRQALALRPAQGIGECVCGCDMHVCDRCSCGARSDNIELTVYMGCSTLCYPTHFTALLAAGRLDDARALYRRIEALVLPAFAHLGEAESRRALASWLLYDAVCCYQESARVDAAAAALAHEMVGTCVFRQYTWESPDVLGVEGAIARGHYACVRECLTAKEIGEPLSRLWSLLGCVDVTNVLDRAADAGDDPVALDRLAFLCRGVQQFNATASGVGLVLRRRIGPEAIAIIRQHAPAIGRIECNEPRTPAWTSNRVEALWEAFLAGRFDEADRMCALAREALGDADNNEDAKRIHFSLNGACTTARLHRHVLAAADPAVGTNVADILSRHFPRAWAAAMRDQVFGRCWRGEGCMSCTAVLHTEHLAHVERLSLGGHQVCFALWPLPHERGYGVEGSRARALALLRHPSALWPRRVALTAAAYGDIEVLEALAPERIIDATPTPSAPPSAWTVDVVALLAAAGYVHHARDMASRYGIDYRTVDVVATIAALDSAKPGKPWSRLYSADVPRCPLPLTVLLHVPRADTRRTIEEAVERGVGVPVNAVDAVHLAAAFPGLFDGHQAARVLKPTTAVGAIDWLCGQTRVRFDAAYVTACASIGATGVVHHLVVRRGIACDVDAVRAALPHWVGSFFEPWSDGDDSNGDGDGDARGPAPAWIDFMEPALRAAAAGEIDAPAAADDTGADPCEP
ncbi:hypothetical protein pdul_cds_651 [Pandoravirus dulcis]|uniref:Uncharacterized protein n=1 Tax=Pandoravirus dulcis TaxID=1349409 RepID=S4VTP6_9VIRU|nr:hypothetical protein pdul_cds_651 [Pandoravirus dulcis]AGO82795.1 hypothetical protein pdul_cds_651 [Pandoravirus dulcis]